MACVLLGCRITNAVKCVPPGNKPTPAEIRNCNGYLAAELASLGTGCRHAGARCDRAWCGACGARAAAVAATASRTLPSTTLPTRHADDRFLSLQPLQHADAAPDAADVPDGRRARAPHWPRSRPLRIRTMAGRRFRPAQLPRRRYPRSPACTACSMRTATSLYVGKARHLKNRVQSYFHGRAHTSKTLVDARAQCRGSRSR